MTMHWRNLILARNHDLFGIEHTATTLEIFSITIARGEEKQTQIGKFALTVICNVPSEATVENCLRITGSACFQLFWRPISKGRHDITKRADESVALADNLINF